MTYELSLTAWVLLAVAALLVGVSKTALPGVNMVSVAIFAALIPARESTGALLLLLMAGDIMALLAYRRHAHLPTLARLVPAVLLGLLAGAGFLLIANDAWVQRAIGGLLLSLMALTLWQRHRATQTRSKDGAPSPQNRSGARWLYGSLGGFSTMVANSGGPVMSMYFLAVRFEAAALLGTAAWFFAVMNAVKLPFLVGMGLVSTQTLALDIWLLPAVLAGGLLGRWLISKIDQTLFERLVIWITVLGALWLLVR